MANLKEYDLVLYYTGRDNIYLGRIISITPVVSKDIFASWVDIQSIRMLCGSEKYNISEMEFTPHTVLSINIKKSFGNISIDEFIEGYPEWQI